MAVYERPQLVLSERDRKFVAELQETVSAWLRDSSEPTLTLPAVNSYLRMLQYRELEAARGGADGTGGFYVQKARISGCLTSCSFAF